MDVKQIKYFLEVSKTGSFTSAAKKLYISAPGLVKSMDKLEEELGVRLFVRMRTGVSLTPAGHVLARYARPYIRQHEHILGEVKKAGSQREARVEVCMSWGMLSFFPRDFLSRFIVGNPDVSLSTRNYALGELHESLLEYRETIGLYFGKIDDPSLDVLFHRKSPLHLLMSRTHPLASRRDISLSDLRTCKIVVVNSDPDVTRALEKKLEEAGCSVQIMLDGLEWTQALDLITGADYVSFCLPGGDPSNLLIRTHPVDDLDLSVEFNMAVLHGVALSDAEKRFVDYVLKLMNSSRGKAYIKEENGG